MVIGNRCLYYQDAQQFGRVAIPLSPLFTNFPPTAASLHVNRRPKLESTLKRHHHNFSNVGRVTNDSPADPGLPYPVTETVTAPPFALAISGPTAASHECDTEYGQGND